MESKYTKELLAEAVNNSTSLHGVLRLMGLRITGGSQGHIKRLIQMHGLSTAHFTGQAHGKGCAPKTKIHWTKILVLNRNKGLREHATKLRRALIESGTIEQCVECGLSTHWNGKPLRLQVDHIDGNPLDNRKENLRFLCPNCHSQTETFGFVGSTKSKTRRRVA